MSESDSIIRITGGGTQPWRDRDPRNQEEIRAWESAGYVGNASGPDLHGELNRLVGGYIEWWRKHGLENQPEPPTKLSIKPVFLTAGNQPSGRNLYQVDVVMEPTEALPNITQANLKDMAKQMYEISRTLDGVGSPGR